MLKGPLLCFPQNKPWVEVVELSFSSLPSVNDFSIVLLSDLHITHSMNLEQMFAMVRMLSPTLLFLLGDYFSTYKKKKVDEFFSLLSQINPPMGKFAVLGNQEDADFFPSLFEKAGTALLRDEYIFLQKNSLNLLISGVDYGTPNIYSLLRSLPLANLSILLSHSPDIVLSPGDWRKVDLVVSGHTHGGQFRFPIIGAIFTKSRLPRRYASGLTHFPGLYLYVSRGIGTSRLPLRFACPSEITFLRIKGVKKND